MITLDIPTMTCGHCVRTITETVQAADPAAQVQADLAAHRVQVQTSEPRDKLAARLAEAGYAPA